MKKAIFLLSLLLILSSNIFSYTITVHYEVCHDVQVKVGEDCYTKCDWDAEGECWEVCTPIYETREECETKTQSYTVPESTSPEELQTAIVEATYESVTNTEDELDENTTDAVEEINDLEELKQNLIDEVKQAKEDIREKYDQSLAQTSGDPVRTAIGTFITSETDVSYNDQLFEIQISRRFDSANMSEHSLGKGWTFNYDTRIIHGENPDADILLQQAKATYDNIRQTLTESRSLYNSTLTKVNDLIDALSDVLNTLNTTITNLENSYDSAPSRIKPRIQDDLENARSKKSEMTAKLDNAYTLKADLENSYAIIEELEIKQAYALSELERIKDMKALSDTNNELNEYVHNSSDPEYYQYSGINTLTLIDKTGTPTTYKIDTPPDYESTVQLSGDVTSYWPEGSSTTPLSPTDAVLKLLPSGGFTVSEKDGTLYDYNFYGQLQSITDRNENTIELSYSDDGRLQSIVDEFGRKLTIIMDSGKRITSITDPANNQVFYSYDSSGYLSSVTDLDDDTVQYTYYPTGEIEKIIKPDGSFRKYNYMDQNGRRLVSSTVDEEGATEHFYYHFDEGYTE
jgi:YD repeat-containing protein